MNRDAVLSFSRQAREVRENVFGEIAKDASGQEIPVTAYPLNDLQLEAGGFERRGAIRAIMAQELAPAMHALLTMRDKKYRVVSITEANAFGDTSQNWEPLP